jgi:formylglycine-generating enzyme required for sulfatase activity
VNYASANAAKTWRTDRDFYIGLFPVTQTQYIGVSGGADTQFVYFYSSTTANPAARRPAENKTWNDLRGEGTDPAEPIPVVDSDTGTFFQRLNYRTGNKFAFDLPTEVMFEIAERAGATTVYSWGGSWVDGYAVCGVGALTWKVGIKNPNAWGIYDTAGDVWEWCRDAAVSGNMTERTDAFTPASDESVTSRRIRGGGWCNDSSSSANFRASCRSSKTANTKDGQTGFRIAMIVE